MADIDNKLIDLFTEKKNVKSKNNLKDNSEFEIKNIEFNLNKHLSEKQKLKYKKVTISEADNLYDSSRFNQCINDEISEKFKTKKWSGIPLYMKWNMVKKYLEETDSMHLINEYKTKLSNNKLNIVYDHNEQKITDCKIIT